MGRDFKVGDALVARWVEYECGKWELVTVAPIFTEQLPALIEWLQAGPPQKRWRVTRTFETYFPPAHFQIRDELSKSWYVGDLTDADVEEVWE